MFYDDIKQYLENKIISDNDTKDIVKVKPQYNYGEKPKPPEILLNFIDDYENASATTFEGEKASTIFLQMIVMANSMAFSGTKYNAQKSCNLLSDKVKQWFDKTTICQSITDMLNIRRVQKTDAIPYETGTGAYYSILRYEITYTY